MVIRRTVSFAVLLLLALVGTAFAKRMPESYRPAPDDKPVTTRHDTKFRTVPGSKLQIRAVEYNGSVNGVLVVELKNPTKAKLAFDATGLYFIPDGDPDTAPQRLGAVGPVKVATSEVPREMASIQVPAGTTVEVMLDVFCIDSHRGSPGPENVFHVAKKRMPKELATRIDERTEASVKKYKADGAARPRAAAKSDIQSEVWRSRDEKWIQLDGEGAQEATK